jgi:hypothetical protein
VESVRAVVDQLRAALPEIIPRRDQELVRMLRAVRHIHRYRASDTRRGRPSKWKRQDLLRVSARLSEILERETHSHISLSSFVDHYLRLLEFPADVLRALSAGEINLFEAEQLARVVAGRLGVTAGQAVRARADLLSAHVRAKLSGQKLRQSLRRVRLSVGYVGTWPHPGLCLSGNKSRSPDNPDMRSYRPQT